MRAARQKVDRRGRFAGGCICVHLSPFAPHVSLMPMFPTPSPSPVLLTTLLLLVPAMSAFPASPQQLVSLQLLSPLTSLWTYPMNESFHGLPMYPGPPSNNPFCLNPGSPREPSPSALCPGAAFANSHMRVMPSPSFLCCCPAYGPVPCAPWATTPMPDSVDHPTCIPTPAHPSPGSPGSPSSPS